MSIEKDHLVVISYSVIFEFRKSPMEGFDFAEVTNSIRTLLRPLESEKGYRCDSGFHFQYIDESNARQCDRCHRWTCDIDNKLGIECLLPGKQHVEGYYCSVCRDVE